jgi:hypothetical protein
MTMDGYRSHIDYDLFEWAESRNIICILLFPNSTHIAQPLDVAVFRPFKSSWQKHVQTFKANENQKKTKLDEKDFIKLLTSTIKDSMKPELIQKSFRVTGLHPLNAQAINRDKIIAHAAGNCEVHHVLETEQNFSVTGKVKIFYKITF